MFSLHFVDYSLVIIDVAYDATVCVIGKLFCYFSENGCNILKLCRLSNKEKFEYVEPR